MLTEEEIIQIVCFGIDKEEYGLEIGFVREIIRVIQITPVPMSPKAVLGVINLRGSVIPIVNFRALLSLENAPTTVETRIIVIEENSLKIGILVDRVSEVLRLPKSSFETTPHGTDSGVVDFIDTVAVLENMDSMLLMVNVYKLFQYHTTILEKDIIIS